MTHAPAVEVESDLDRLRAEHLAGLRELQAHDDRVKAAIARQTAPPAKGSR